MSAIIAKESGDGDFVLAPEGTHVAVCIGVVDMGTHRGEYMGKPKSRRMVRVTWELPDEVLEGENGAAVPMMVGKLYTLSLGEKAVLRHDLESWRGRAFTEAERAGFDISKLAGVACLVTIVHEKKNDKTYANVKGVTKIPKGTPPPKAPFNEPKVFSIADGRNSATFKALPEWLQKKIGECIEWNSAPAEPEGHNKGSDEPPQSDDVPF